MFVISFMFLSIIILLYLNNIIILLYIKIIINWEFTEFIFACFKYYNIIIY